MKHDPAFIAEAKAATNVYNLAADAIEKYGHVKGKLQDDQGRLCLLGALNFVLTGNAFDPNSGVNKLPAMIPLISTNPFMVPSDLVHWNNAPERTQAEVVGLLRKAALVL